LMTTVGAIGVVTAGNSSAATYNHDVYTFVFGPSHLSRAAAEQDLDSIATACRHTQGYGYPDTSSFDVRSESPLFEPTRYTGWLKCYALR
jgi:hypothetical protein